MVGAMTYLPTHENVRAALHLCWTQIRDGHREFFPQAVLEQLYDRKAALERAADKIGRAEDLRARARALRSQSDWPSDIEGRTEDLRAQAAECDAHAERLLAEVAAAINPGTAN